MVFVWVMNVKTCSVIFFGSRLRTEIFLLCSIVNYALYVIEFKEKKLIVTFAIDLLVFVNDHI